jgi:hypothetical protein
MGTYPGYQLGGTKEDSMRDHKDVFNEAHYEATESGKSVAEADNLANDAMADWCGSMLDMADMARKQERGE